MIEQKVVDPYVRPQKHTGRQYIKHIMSKRVVKGRLNPVPKIASRRITFAAEASKLDQQKFSV